MQSPAAAILASLSLLIPSVPTSMVEWDLLSYITEATLHAGWSAAELTPDWLTRDEPPQGTRLSNARFLSYHPHPLRVQCFMYSYRQTDWTHVPSNHYFTVPGLSWGAITPGCCCMFGFIFNFVFAS